MAALASSAGSSEPTSMTKGVAETTSIATAAKGSVRSPNVLVAPRKSAITEARPV